jgi:hypothetical protein
MTTASQERVDRTTKRRNHPVKTTSGSPPEVMPLVPLHRNSITQPSPSKAQKLVKEKPNIPYRLDLNTLRPLRESAPSRNGNQEESFDDFMSAYCVEPPNDAETCLMGTFVTCVLFGKTHWRLNRIANGLNPQDEEWKFNGGCNGACWTQFAMSMFLVDCLGGKSSTQFNRPSRIY